jgi:hypothetical protein
MTSRHKSYETWEIETLEGTDYIGEYGRKWANFMIKHYPELVAIMLQESTYSEVARSVDTYAREYKQLLDRQYEQLHPRPCEWEDEKEHRSWKFTRDFYTDGAVMREQVLQPRRAV